MGKPAKPPTPVTYTLSGGSGADTFEALGGQLKLNGTLKSVTPGATQITLSGGDGNDTFRIDALHDFGGVPITYDGGAGSDTIDFSQSSQGVAVNLFQQGKGTISTPQSITTGFTLVLNSALSPDYYVAGDPSKSLVTDSSTIKTSNLVNFENVIGSAYDDWIYLAHIDGRTDTLKADGGGGNDYIQGGVGPDLLIGGAGNDFLFGKAGNDTLTGGSGADQFQVITYNGVDVITDYNPAEDHLYIGWQQSVSEIATASNWYATTWTDSNGVVHNAIKADFVGGGVILVDLTLESVAAVTASTTTFDWFG